MELRIRDYLPSDAPALTDIFYDTIHEIGLEHYTPAEVLAWAPLPIDYPRWQQRLDDLPPFVAEIERRLVGFLTLTDQGHIEWTYTHKDHQRRGIASALYAHMERVAKQRGLRRLTVNASRFARPFFAKQGFRVVRQEAAERMGETLVNWLMEKVLSESSAQRCSADDARVEAAGNPESSETRGESRELCWGAQRGRTVRSVSGRIRENQHASDSKAHSPRARRCIPRGRLFRVSGPAGGAAERPSPGVRHWR